MWQQAHARELAGGGGGEDLPSLSSHAAGNLHHSFIKHLHMSAKAPVDLEKSFKPALNSLFYSLCLTAPTCGTGNISEKIFNLLPSSLHVSSRTLGLHFPMLFVPTCAMTSLLAPPSHSLARMLISIQPFHDLNWGQGIANCHAP